MCNQENERQDARGRTTVNLQTPQCVSAFARHLTRGRSMGVWCASATDVQPRERKTGCARTDDRESSDAPMRQRIRAPLDKGPVNGRPLSRKLPAVDERRLMAD